MSTEKEALIKYLTRQNPSIHYLGKVKQGNEKEEKRMKKNFISEKKKTLRSWEEHSKKPFKTLQKLRKRMKDDKGKKVGYKRKVAIPLLSKTQRLVHLNWTKQKMRKVIERTVLPAIMIPVAELLLEL